tara:strand:+ start:18762 stop:19775 length:1014 start_codon:yes stop_codon:yes gene_type:complete
MSQSIFKKAKLLTSVVCAFGITSNAIADDKVTVVSSFSIISDLLTQVGGEHIDVTTLVKINSDAHVYSPTPKDALAVKNAQLLVMNGLGFEGWMPRFLESAHFSGTKVIASEGINVIEIDDEDHHEEHEEHDDHEEHANKHNDHDEHEHEEHANKHDDHDHGATDPHAWHSIDNVIIYVQNIEKGLSKVDPKNRSDYKNNALAYIKKLEQLKVELQAQINTIPLAQRKAITPHDAFAYLSRDLNIEFIAPQGTSTESEPSASDMAIIIKQIRKDKIAAVFMENITDNRIIEQISRETDAHIGGKLFSGALSEASGPAPTYIAMMQHNVMTIVKALTH